MPGRAEQLQKLEGRFQLYEKQHNEVLSDTRKQAILKANAPAAIKAQIDLQTFATSTELKETMSNYMAVQASSSGGPAPMDIGGISKGKDGKGKSGKGKDTKGGHTGKGDSKDKSKAKGDGKGKTGTGKGKGKGP